MAATWRNDQAVVTCLCHSSVSYYKAATVKYFAVLKPYRFWNQAVPEYGGFTFKAPQPPTLQSKNLKDAGEDSVGTTQMKAYNELYVCRRG